MGISWLCNAQRASKPRRIYRRLPLYIQSCALGLGLYHPQFWSAFELCSPLHRCGARRTGGRRRVLQFGTKNAIIAVATARRLDGVLLSEREETFDRPLRGGRCVLHLQERCNTQGGFHRCLRRRHQTRSHSCAVGASTDHANGCFVSSDTESEVDSHSESDDAVDVGTENGTANREISQPRVVLASATQQVARRAGQIPELPARGHGASFGLSLS